MVSTASSLIYGELGVCHERGEGELEVEGDKTEAQGDSIEAQGDTTEAEGDTKEAEGDTTEAEGDAKKQKVTNQEQNRSRR